LPGVHDLDVEGVRVSCEVDTDKLDGLLKRLTEAGVRSLTSQPPTLEQLFLRHYSGDLPGGDRPGDEPGGGGADTQAAVSR
jgi:ABC-2 type transport system ATP-binding protein